ncbi:MAG: DNA-binding domain-containing protein [Bacteroidales bacterium]
MDYTLYKNRFNPNAKQKFIARHTNIQRKSFDNLIKQITKQGSIFKEPETVAIIHEYWNTIKSYIEDGIEYQDDYIDLKLGISGPFDDENEGFNKKKHKVTVSLTPGGVLKKSTKHIEMHHVNPKLNVVKLERIAGFGMKENETTFKPKSIVEIKGQNLKIYSKNDKEGIFFHNVATQTEYQVENIYVNEPQTLVFMIPTLDKGDYIVAINNSSRNGCKLRNASIKVSIEQ